jgi:hypothetical protein
VEDQLEVNLVSIAGQESAVLSITAFIPGAGQAGNYIYSDTAVVAAGDTVGITLSIADGPTATTVASSDAALELDPADDVICSFCGKNQNDVARIVAGSNAFICDACIELCYGIIEK